MPVPQYTDFEDLELERYYRQELYARPAPWAPPAATGSQEGLNWNVPYQNLPREGYPGQPVPREPIPGSIQPIPPRYEQRPRSWPPPPRSGTEGRPLGRGGPVPEQWPRYGPQEFSNEPVPALPMQYRTIPFWRQSLFQPMAPVPELPWWPKPLAPIEQFILDLIVRGRPR